MQELLHNYCNRSHSILHYTMLRSVAHVSNKRIRLYSLSDIPYRLGLDWQHLSVICDLERMS